ncbi:MAG: menaquinone biosynthesis protein [Acidobacteriota bacterium]|nr:menaquinone biosynthesis protein [Acidobacteriota bacterium]
MTPVAGPVRLGAVDYLNVRPLVHGLDSVPSEFSLRFDPPSLCASLLHSGEIDLGMIPTIAYQHRDGYRVVPGTAIASEGPVASVALYTRVPLSKITRIAADTSSNTSVALLRVLSVERFRIHPELVPAAPDLAAMMHVAEAALLIGDPALFADHVSMGLEKIDLGEEWTRMTGLPFVWAFWAGRDGVIDPVGVERLQRARREGESVSDRLADAYAAGYAARTGAPADAALARRYLKDNIKYGLGEREVAAVERFHALALAAGIVSRAEPIRFY